jgi:hypothetical protein
VKGTSSRACTACTDRTDASVSSPEGLDSVGRQADIGGTRWSL